MFAEFIGFVFCLGAPAARAQNVQPFVDCVEIEQNSDGSNTGKYIAYFGYINYVNRITYVPLNTAGNIMSPVRNPPGQPKIFCPALIIALLPSNLTWARAKHGGSRLGPRRLPSLAHREYAVMMAPTLD